MNTEHADIATDVCYRCGYDLRATPDDRPCPECGLLAGRSQRPSDELRHTRPRWLLGLAFGTVLILVAILMGSMIWIERAVLGRHYVLWQWPSYLHHRSWMGIVAADIFLFGVIFFTRPEGYPVADRADRRRRLFLRLATIPPIAGALLQAGYPHLNGGQLAQIAGWFGTIANHAGSFGPQYYTTYLLDLIAFFLTTAGAAPAALLLFLHLRRLARRARGKELARHCAFLGIGSAAALLYFSLVVAILGNPEFWGLRSTWISSSPMAAVLTLGLTVIICVFPWWCVVLLTRFAISFMAAARAARRV